MKLLKRITAVMAALLIVFNVTVVNIFAVAAAPVVAAGGFVLFLSALLLAGGHSQSEIDLMSVDQMQSTVVSDFNSGNITRDTIVTDPFTGENFEAMDYLYYHEFYDFRDNVNSTVNSAVNGFIDSIVSVVDGEVKLNEDYFTAISTTDIIDGYGACIVVPPAGGGGIVYHYCQYAVIDVDNDTITLYGPSIDETHYYHNGSTFWSRVDTKNYTWDPYLTNQIIAKYGDIRYKDGTEVPTDDEYIIELGETADGTKVTADMLNPDGTVTIDGVTYYPSDYLDPDKLTDTGKDALLAALLSALANKYVKSEDKPIVDVDDIPIEVAEEFQDYAVPVGIANVFPFCIPWDIVRGFQLLNRPAVTPKFEIPFNIPEFGLFPGVEKSITLDFSEYDTYIQIFRWFQLLGFSFLLCRLSMTQVKGAGA